MRDSVLFHMRQKYMVNLELVVSNPTKFTNALEEIFGSGSRLIEKEITRILGEKLQIDYRGKDFVKVIEEAKSQLDYF